MKPVENQVPFAYPEWWRWIVNRRGIHLGKIRQRLFRRRSERSSLGVGGRCNRQDEPMLRNAVVQASSCMA